MQVKFFATFRKITQEKEIQMSGAASVAELFQQVVKRYALDSANNFLLAAGKLHPDTIILVNGRAIEHLDGLNTVLRETDTISIFPRIAGG